jgi:ABC-type nitrate/sulfonate/bicarbonate transport system substrate-binding protein
MTARNLRIGFIPLVDAAALLIAADKGFAAAEGLSIELAPEASWSNIRDKLAIGLFDAAHLLAPMAVATSLGLGHVKVPLIAPIMLAVNGNAITVSPALHAELTAQGDMTQPAASARALAQIVERRQAHGLEPLTFGMTFPFSMHNYLLRAWMADGGIDPDEDVRLVVLPPPYMVENLARGQLDGFCVGAPWNSVAVDARVGVVLHFGCEIFPHAPEKVLALRQSVAAADPSLAEALIRATRKGAAFVDDAANRDEVCACLARPDRVGVDAQMIRRTLEGRLHVNAEGEERSDARYLVIGKDGASRPDPSQAAWLYAQMLRWGQTHYSPAALESVNSVWRADLYDAALGEASAPAAPVLGLDFDARDLRPYLNGFAIGAKI